MSGVAAASHRRWCGGGVPPSQKECSKGVPPSQKSQNEYPKLLSLRV
ncbi:MAG: hypothetical protein IKZ84_00585 [Victivallales bacterium]|nr:hypothetical protein [Victivallales bacterium]MBR5837009.1 hypothetical protein [Victivallales bacterium]